MLPGEARPTAQARGDPVCGRTDIIRQPLVTEKSTRGRETGAVYCFKADVRANKVQIASAVARRARSGR